MTDSASLDAPDAMSDNGAFNRRLANLLRAGRDASGASRRRLARRSNGRFDARQLGQIEDGSMVVDHDAAVELAGLYRVDLSSILGDRLPVQVEADGTIRTGGVAEEFDPGDQDSLLTAYVCLVRRLRRQQRAEFVDLRRDDVEILAGHLGVSGVSVVERLGTLMGATRARRSSMAALFGAGAAVIGLTTGVAAISMGDSGTPDSPTPTPAAAVVADPAADTGVLDGGAGTPDVAPADQQVAPVAPVTTEGGVRDAHVSPVIIGPSQPVDQPVDQPGPTPTAAPAPTPAPAPAPTPPTSPPPPGTTPATTTVVAVGPPPVPPVTSPPPVDTVPVGTPVEVAPPPPVVPPDDVSD